MREKGLVPILIVLILAALVGGYFTFQNQPKPTPSPQPITQPSPTSDPTASSQTYTNKKLGFSIDYPSTLAPKEGTRDYAFIGKSTYVTFIPRAEIQKLDYGFITVEVEDSKSGLTVDGFINNLCDSPGVCAKAENAIPIVISGMKGKKVIDHPAPLPSQMAVVIKENKVYHISVTLINDNDLYRNENKEREQIFNSMLSTFKFLP